jgi:adenylate cyclase
LQTVGHELGVHYVVEGSVRKAGDRVRITVRLVEVESGNHLWAERYDRDFEDIFSVQDEVTETIVAHLAGRLDDAERERTLRKTTENLSAYDLVLKGKFVLRRGSQDNVLQAREVFARALELDANHAQAYVQIAHTYILESQSNWTEAPDREAGI